MTIVEATQAGFAKLEALFSSKLSLEADLQKARNENAELQATIKRQEQEIQNLKATGAAATEKANADAKNIIDLQAALKAKDEEITTLKAGAKSAGEKAAEMLSNASVPAGQLPNAGGNGETREQKIDALRAQLKNCTDARERFRICEQISAVKAGK